MELARIVSHLDADFAIHEVTDDWSHMFDELFIEKSLASFRKKGKNTGLMIQNSHEIQHIYLAVSPSRYVLEEIRMRGIVNCLLIVKYPFDWDGRRNSPGFLPFTEREYQLMEGMSISVYSLHVPLEKNRTQLVVSSAQGCARFMKLKVTEELQGVGACGALKNGVIGTVSEKKLSQLVKRLTGVLDYRVKVQQAGGEFVGKVALVPGQGLLPAFIAHAQERGVTTYITGVISPNASKYDRLTYKERFRAVRKLGVTLLGCSMYLTEKWALVYSLPYFSTICKSAFIEDKEALNLLE
jgi:putative NIF3 family GTP cyclohydrolase 1 type 2